MDQSNNPPTIPGSGNGFSPPDYQNDPLWQRICQHELDDKKAARPLSRKLAEEQKWPPEFTERAIAEYKKFVYLCCISPHGASPSQIVDEVWHMHLTYTTDYWGKFCKETLEQELHHYPSTGGPEEKLKHDRWYGETLRLYTSTFNEPPPEDYWPPPPPFEIDPEPIVLPKHYFREAGSLKRWLLLTIPFLLILAFYSTVNPFHLKGPEFLFFFIVLNIVSFIAVSISLQAKNSLLEELISNNLSFHSKYELEFLRGDKERMALNIVGELLDEEILIPLGDKIFQVDKTKVKNSPNPLAEVLSGYDQITSEEIKQQVGELNLTIQSKFSRIDWEYDNRFNNRLVPLLAATIGTLRLIQGFCNHRPIGFLAALLIIFYLVYRLLFKANTFESTCRYLFRDAYRDTSGDWMIQDTGILAITGLWWEENNRSWVKATNNGNGSGGGCSGSGGGCSGGGGSCGGGCGGCGGCGG